MKAQERLYLTADRNSLVGQGSPKAAFLYAALGDEIPPSAVEKFGLVDGRLKPAKAAKSDAEPPKPKAPAKVDKSKAEDKEQKAGETKGG